MPKQILSILALCLLGASAQAETIEQILHRYEQLSTQAAALRALDMALAQTRYVVTAIAVGSGTGINNHGDVTGTLSANNHAFLYKKGRLLDLGVFQFSPSHPNTMYSSSGFAVNDSDAVAGRISDDFPGESFFPEDSFLYQNGQMSDIAEGGTDGGFGSSVGGINNSGEVVGSYDAGGTITTPPASPESATARAFLYRNGQQFDIGTLGGLFSLGNGINNAGQIVGVSSTVGRSLWQAFLYGNGSMQIIGGAQSGNFTPWAINDNGWIAGTITSSPTNPNIFDGNNFNPPFGFAARYINGNLTSLGTLAGFTGSQGLSLNNSGTIIGNLTGLDPTLNIDSVLGVFIYTGGRMFNLNNLVEGNWKILTVGHINDAGQIAATGTRPGSTVTYALLLTPKWMLAFLR